MRNKLYTLLILIATFALSSCDEFLSVESEINTTATTQFKTEADAQNVINGIMKEFRYTIGDYVNNYRDRALLLDGMSLVWWKGINNFDYTGLEKDEPLFNWTNEYLTISVANSAIKNLALVDMPEERYHYYMGVALCVRAYMYFHIIRLWGDAPLVVDFEDVSEKGRTPWREIATHIIADLTQAIEYLPTEDAQRDASGAAFIDKQIPCKGTAYAILSHVYAWLAGYGGETEYYAKGIEAATKVIEDVNYHLAGTPEEVSTQVLKGNSPEGIYEVSYSYAKGETKNSGSYIAGAIQRWPIQPLTTTATARPYYILNSTVYSLYESTDLRRAAYFRDIKELEPVSQGKAFIQMWRNTVLHESGALKGRLKTYDMNEIIFRLADIILLRAEMEAAAGKEAEAIADLNRIRKRAGATAYTTSEGDLRKAIQSERDRELLFQTCVRYFDHMRNHTYTNLKGGYKTLTEQDVKNGALFLPVSASAFVNNPQMTQTVYWNVQFRN